jgi:hypothetical protein
MPTLSILRINRSFRFSNLEFRRYFRTGRDRWARMRPGALSISTAYRQSPLVQWATINVSGPSGTHARATPSTPSTRINLERPRSDLAARPATNDAATPATIRAITSRSRVVLWTAICRLRPRARFINAQRRATAKTMRHHRGRLFGAAVAAIGARTMAPDATQATMRNHCAILSTSWPTRSLCADGLSIASGILGERP